MSDDVADDLWNEAANLGASDAIPAGVPSGQAHLARLLRFHNSAMGGGLGFAVEVNEPDRIEAAAQASEYFGLSELAEFLRGLGEPDAAEELTDRYYELTGESGGGEDVIEPAFRAKLVQSPQDFGRGR